MPKHDLLAAIRAETWTSHNISLSETESTLGDRVGLIGDDVRTKVIKSLVRCYAPSTPRILDLGSLEGGLSLEMAREGWVAVGVEGRESNYRKAELVREYFALPNLSFRLQDVKAIDPAEGLYDVILCCGLLYHLDDPFAFIEKMSSLMTPDGFLFLDTHVAAENTIYAPRLSAETAIGAYTGRWFDEPQGGTTLDEQWSAVSNTRSFWPDRRSLIRALYHAGFHAIHELFGMFDIDGEFALRDQYSRLYLLCRRGW